MNVTRKDIELVEAKARQIRAVVVGDTMIDRYIYGTVERISPEAPVPIVHHQRTETKAGGAANVALNLAAWGCDTTLVGLTGKDAGQTELAALLENENIHHHLIAIDNRPTTIKTRVVASSHHLLRIDEESVAYLSGDEEAAILQDVRLFLESSQFDLVILQDYNKGFLTQGIISAVIQWANAKGVFIAVDPKERHFFDYRQINLMKPNLREASIAAGKSLKNEDLDQLAASWQNSQSIEHVAITLGSQGVFLKNKMDGRHILPDRSVDVIDVCGAGDAVVCSLALSFMANLNLATAGGLANLAGAFVCSHSGVVKVDPAALKSWL